MSPDNATAASPPPDNAAKAGPAKAGPAKAGPAKDPKPPAKAAAPAKEGAATPDQDHPQDQNQGIGGLRNGLSAAVAQPGTTDERLSVEREALAGLGSFARATVNAGQVVGGDSYVLHMGTGTDRVRMFRLTVEELDETTQAFIPPPGCPEAAEERTESNAVALLYGPSGSGRYATARFLLLSAGARTVYRLDPSTDPDHLNGDDLEEGAGYILAEPTATGLAAEFRIQRLEAELAKRGCRLIVTLPESARTGGAGLNRYEVVLTGPPDHHSVLRAHLHWRLGPGGAEQVGQLLARADVRALLDGTGTVHTSRVAEIARLLAHSTGPVDQAVAGVRAGLDAHDDLTRADWFAGIPDLATQCLAVAAAVFGGEAYETVAALAVQLDNMIETARGDTRARVAPPTRLDATRRHRLAAIHAVIVDAEVTGRRGTAPGAVLRYIDPALSPWVLDHVWTEYDAVRAVIPAWLSRCARHDQPTVRVRAAVTAGVLATRAFDNLRAALLEPWARSEDERERDAAATALSVAARDPRHTKAAQTLCDAWSTDYRAELRTTAVRTWRVLLDRADPGPLWSLLHNAAADDDDDVMQAVCSSMAEYLASDELRAGSEAVGLLTHWVQKCGLQRATIGELAFLYAAADLETPSGHPAARPVPTLLVLATTERSRYADIAALWSAAVNSRTFYGVAQEVLTKWAFMVEKDPAARDDLARLITAAVTTRRTELIIRHLANSWRVSVVRDGSAAPAPRCARRVLDLLDERNAGHGQR